MRQTEAILFDVYGTLVEIRDPRRPYRQLVELARSQGCALDPTQTARLVMCHADGLAEAAERLECALSPTVLRRLEQELQEEISSIQLYPETERVLETLHDRGLKIGLCSNLAAPYVAPALERVGHLVDQAVWSCTAGRVKPDPAIFIMAAEALRQPPASVLMVGDSYDMDVLGARRAGLQAVWLDRQGTAGDIATLSALLDAYDF